MPEGGLCPWPVTSKQLTAAKILYLANGTSSFPGLHAATCTVKQVAFYFTRYQSLHEQDSPRSMLE